MRWPWKRVWVPPVQIWRVGREFHTISAGAILEYTPGDEIIYCGNVAPGYHKWVRR